MTIETFHHYSQGDPKWATILNKRTMASAGCFVCCIAMVARHKTGNEKATPLELDHFLDTHNGYNASNDSLFWAEAVAWVKSLGCKVANMKKWDYFLALKKELPMPAIVEVLTGRKTTHFVVLLDAEKGVICDPGIGPGKVNQGITTLEIKKYIPISVRFFE